VADRVLSTRQLNRALLARQLLLERTETSIIRALERVAGLQAQYAPSAYVALWSRMRGFRRAALTKALEDRRAVQATLMRATIHIVSAQDFPLFAAAVRQARRDWWVRVQRGQLEGVDADALVASVRRHLADGPRRQKELDQLLEADGFPGVALGAAGIFVDLVRVPPSGTWERRRADLYSLADSWLGRSSVTETEGLEHLVRCYLRGFGPASLADISTWAQLPVTTLRPVLDRLPLQRFHDEKGGELVDVPGAPLPDAETPAPVRFLPTWDATFLTHVRRTQLLPERYRPRIFHTKNPQSVPTFLVDGSVAGTWRYQDGHVRLEPFERLPRTVMRQLEMEAEGLAALHAG
jgi:winged helix DNA-binding protein